MLEYEAAVVRKYRKIEKNEEKYQEWKSVPRHVPAASTELHNFRALSDGNGVYDYSTCWA
jgi:hypothetical protein